MTESEILKKAKKIADPIDPDAWLDNVCRSNDTMRERLRKRLVENDQLEFEGTSAESGNRTGFATNAGTNPFFAPDGKERLVPADELCKLRQLLQPPSRAGYLGRLAHYEIESALGVGAFGMVVKAFDERLQRVVAIKFMNLEMASTSPPRKRFLREARAAASVRHENIVAIHSVEEKPVPWLIMEYIPGFTLQQRLDELGPLEISEVLKFSKQVAAGLAAAHSAHLIHRDIKPSNILLEGSLPHRAKITDFGLARAMDDASLSASGMVAGTPLYMSPEQARGETLDYRCDLFGLGCVMYQMVSGHPPFRAANSMAVLKRVCEDTPRSLTEIHPETPLWLEKIIFRLLEKRPDGRFQSAREVVGLLERCERAIETRQDYATMDGLVGGMVLKERKASRVLFRKFFDIGTAATVIILIAAFLFYGREFSEFENHAPGGDVASGDARTVSHQPAELTGEVEFRFPDPEDLSAVCSIDGRRYQCSELSGKSHFAEGDHTLHITRNGRVQYSTSFKVQNSLKTLVEVIDPERRVAQKVTSLGGSVTARYGDKLINLVSFQNLPDGRFWIQSINGNGLDDDDFQWISRLPEIEALLVRSEMVTDQTVFQIAQTSSLRSVQLYRARITNESTRHLANLKDLVVLTLQESPNLNDDAMTFIQQLGQLEWLNLSATSVSGAGFAHLTGHLHLRRLTMWRSRVDEEGMKAIAGLDHLTYLELAESPGVDDCGLVHLAGMKLQHLNLRHTSISDESVTVIITLKELQHLDVRATGISADGVRRIREALPACIVLSGAA